MVLKYRSELREDLWHAAEVSVILVTVLLMIGSFWFGPICADWLLGQFEEPVQRYHVGTSGHFLPWPVQVHLGTTGCMAVLFLLLGVSGLLLLDKVRSKAIT